MSEGTGLRTAFSSSSIEPRRHLELQAELESLALEHLRTELEHHEPGAVPPTSMKRTHSAPGLSWPDEDELPKITIGVCAMDKKARSKQMTQIINRLLGYGEFEVIVFGDDVILNKPVEEWPVVQTLLSWHSEGFPLHKSQRYVALRKPFCINDVFAQDILLDRRRVYRKLVASGIPVPHHIIVDRDHLPPGQTDPENFIEEEDYVELDGVRICKPFVEKPASGEDHNVHIYYPHSMGGGVKRLFRKVQNRSGDYDPTHPGTVRREGSFIYEEFLTTGGTDVKVYTVGPRYAHAEARKSPVVDGKVQRSSDGKEVRFPVLLSPQEKEVSRMVCLAFGQRVCGFDLLRSERGRSYVCDVNGWSFVKNSHKYYDDAAGILRMVILSAVAPHHLLVATPQPISISDEAHCSVDSPHGAGPFMTYSQSFDDVRSLGVPEGEGARSSDEELRCVLAVIRHGDRTPKQKMKMRITQEPLLALMHKYLDSKGKQAKLKSPNELQELLDVTRELLEQMEVNARRARDEREAAAAAAALSGDPVNAGSDGSNVSVGGSLHGPQLPPDPEMEETREKFRIVKTVLEQGGQFAGINRKVQLKPLLWASPVEGEAPRCIEALLILKHGGVLTHAGRRQAEALGSLFRNIMYPQHGPAGGGLLRLHSTYRHDLKIYSSDEGRVQTSAAAFTKGLLDLEGSSLTPILVSLVKKDAGMLDAFGKGASADIQAGKAELYAQMTWDAEHGTSWAKDGMGWATPMISPPLSPKPHPRASDDGSSHAHPRAGLSAPSSYVGAAGSSGSLAAVTAASIAGASPPLPRASSRLGSSNSLGSATAALLPAGVSGNYIGGLESGGEEGGNSTQQPSPPEEGASDIPGRPHIFPMPPNPLGLLKQLQQLLKVLVDQLREKCLEEARSEEPPQGFSALTQDPKKDWTLEPGKPCSGERLLLVFDRWRKLLKAFYHEKKGQFDISKVPDIYDAAKYDAIHNVHLGLQLDAVYRVAKQLADAVIPNEYGIAPSTKLRIGSMICSQLLGKLLADLASMQDESLQTAGLDRAGDSSVFDVMQQTGIAKLATDEEGPGPAAAASALMAGAPGGGMRPQPAGAETSDEVVGQEPDDDGEDRPLHRLCPSYATDINSPFRHVRTRIYFTSESHMHSLINVLRYCHLGGDSEQAVIGAGGQRMLKDTTELDYMTHLVLRMFENKTLPLHDPARFRVEILFSPGAAYNPFEVIPAQRDHVLPVAPRTPIHSGGEAGAVGVPWAQLERMCCPFAKAFKRPTENPYPFNMSATGGSTRDTGTALNSQTSELDYYNLVT